MPLVPHAMAQLSRNERFLRLFTEVRPGEGTTAILLFANVFLVLLAYYFIKPLREGWIAVSDIEGLSKMEVKAYSSFLQSIILLFVVGWYAQLAQKWDRVTLFTRATLFCISNMIIFWFLHWRDTGYGHRLLRMGRDVQRLRSGPVLDFLC